MDSNTNSSAAEEMDKEGDNVPVNLQQFQQAMFPLAYQQYSRSQQHSLSQPMNLFGNFHGNYNPYYSHQQQTTTTTTGNRPASAPPFLPPMTTMGGDSSSGGGGVPSPSEDSCTGNKKNDKNNSKATTDHTTKKSSSSTNSSGSKNNKNKTKSKGKGKGGGHANKFTLAEDKCLLEAMERYKPIGNINWTSTVNYYNQTQPNGRPQRDQASIAQRFNILHQTKAPTGDPNIPETIREAIRIQAAIVSKAEMKSMNGVLSSDEDEFENPFIDDEEDNDNADDDEGANSNERNNDDDDY